MFAETDHKQRRGVLFLFIRIIFYIIYYCIFFSQYGWLAAKSEFRLERYGPCVVKYPNPLKDIILLRGDIPSLASGKGFL